MSQNSKVRFAVSQAQSKNKRARSLPSQFKFNATQSNSSWADSVKSDPTVSSRSRNSFSKADRSEVNAKLGISLRNLEQGPNMSRVEKMVPNYRKAPDELLSNVYEALRDTLLTRAWPALTVNEQTKSSYVNALLQATNLYFIREQNVTSDNLQIVLENPAKVFDWKGWMDYAVVRQIQERRQAYYFVVECKAGEPLLAMKRCVLYLRDLMNVNPKAQIYYGFITNATDWRLVTLRREPDPNKPSCFQLRYTVSMAYRLLFDGMEKDGEAKRWKDEYSEIVNVIYTILSQRTLR